MRLIYVVWAVIALLASGCTGLATHRSARPVGKGNMEVGFSAAAPTYLGVVASVNAVGGAEGYLRYGFGKRLDGTFNAGPTSLGGKLDFALVAGDRFNLSTGLGLGLVNASGGGRGTVLEAFPGVEEFFGGAIPRGTVLGFGPDFSVLASVGSVQNEVTLGFRAAYFAGAVGFSSNQGSGAGANSGGGGLIAGPVASFTHRGERLIITPELDLYFGRYQVQIQAENPVAPFSAFIVPSVSFALAK